MPRFVSSKSGSYDYLREVWGNVKNWFRENREFVETQIPYYGDYLNTKETAQFWADYKKNTGFTPRYPRRAYGTAGTEQVSHLIRGFRSFKRLYG